MQTITPPDSDQSPVPAGQPNGSGGGRAPDSPPTEPSRGPGDVGIFVAVLAVLAVVMASVAVVFVGQRDGSGGGDAATGGAVTVELSEFALTPAAVTAPVGGSLTVTNTGSVPHNLTITGTDIKTEDLAAGASATLDLSALEPGDYEIVCSVPGHADAGMTGALTVGGNGGDAGSGLTTGAAGPAPATGSDGTSGMSGMDHQMSAGDYSAMTDAMNKTIGEFPAATEGRGNQVLQPTSTAGGVVQFDLTAEVTPWEVEPGKTVDAWTYNGQVPGPQIHVNVGDHVRIVLHNELPMATDMHLHGINVPNSMDGVGPITQDLVQPGESFAYEFTADEVAVAMYHPHHHGQLQMPNGMLGTILVGEEPLPAGRTIGGDTVPADLRVAQEMPMVLNDSGVIGYSLNGKSFPATEPVQAKVGDWILVHYFNEGGQIHPMHLHQFDQIVVAKDGFPLDQPYLADTVMVAPGERYSVLVHLDQPGTWVWHCHILNHVEREEGMYGMVTAVVVS